MLKNAFRLFLFSACAALIIVLTREKLPGTQAFSDGRSELSPKTWEDASRFVWEDRGEIFDESLGSVRGGVLSPRDGRLYFARRDRGRWNIYCAEAGFDGSFKEPEPVFALNSSRNDREPAFSADGTSLVFASDRAGSYDLYLCDVDTDGISEPRRLEAACGEGDERQPVFNTSGEILYFGVDSAAGTYQPRTIDAFLPDAEPVHLGTFWSDSLQIRSAASDSEGRVLLLSARKFGETDFDLYRVVRHGDEFGEPKKIPGLESPEDECDPRFTADGGMLFARSRPDGGGLDFGIHRARMRELDALDIESAFWSLLARILAAVIALLIAGFLALRWKHLHPFLKFLLLSILVHLLLMLYLDPLGTGDADEGGESLSGFAVNYVQQKASRAAFDGATDGGATRLSARTNGTTERPQASRSVQPVDWQASEFVEAPKETRTGKELPQRSSPQRSEPTAQRSLSAMKTARASQPLPSRPESLDGGARPEKAQDLSSAVLTARTGRSEFRLPEKASTSSAAAPQVFTGARESVASARTEAEMLRETRRQPNRSSRGVALNKKAGEAGDGLVVASKDELAKQEGASEEVGESSGRLSGSLRARSFEMPRRSSVESSLRPSSTTFHARRGSLSRKTPTSDLLARSRNSSAKSPSLPVAALSRAVTPRKGLDRLPVTGLSARSFTDRTGSAVPLPRRAPRTGRGVPHPTLLPRTFLVSRGPVALQEETPALPDFLASRRGQAKALALKTGGGDEETEAAVLAGLRYLASRQQQSGAWGSGRLDPKYRDRRAGKTGLSLLAFLGSGYNQQENSEFSDGVRRGILFLLQQQDDETGHIGDSSAYGHGIATYALAEAWAMTRDASLRAPLLKAVRRIIRAQYRGGRSRLDGGWGYYYRNPDRRYDDWPRMSVSVWQIMALKSAKIGGLQVPEKVLESARDYVLRSRDDRLEAVRYNHDPSWLSSGYPTLPGSNSAGLFALQLFDVEESHPTYQAALQFVLEREPRFRWRKASSFNFVNRAHGNLYFHYYAALALHRRGGHDWQAWNERLKPLLLGSQEDDGSWRPISQYNSYADESRGDRSYTTAMCVLMLEVYYRYFTPLTRAHEEAGRVESDEEVPVGGVEVATVRVTGSAARFGLRAGDRIVAVRGRAVDTVNDLRQELKSWPSDANGMLEVLREGRRLTLRGTRRPGGFQAVRSD